MPNGPWGKNMVGQTDGNVRILRAEERDLPAVLQLQYLAFRSEAERCGCEIPPLRQTLEELKGEYVRGFIAKAVDGEGRLVGSVRAVREGESVLVGKLMVHPDHRGKGLGRALLGAIERAVPGRRYELFTSALSQSNIALYTSCGYAAYREDAVAGVLLVWMEKKAAAGNAF